MSGGFLFIGGPKDGLYLNVESNINNVSIPHSHESKIDPVDGCAVMDFERFIYTRRTFTNGMEFFVEQSIKDEDIFGILVDNYRPKHLNTLARSL